jgi:superfamily II DNA or RNA helicase
MQLVALTDVDISDLGRDVGSTTYTRGLLYARKNAVVAMQWDSAEKALHGRVIGSNSDSYDTSAYFASDGRGSRLVFESGECSCPIGYDCKHVAAMVLRAVSPEFTRESSRSAQPQKALDSATGSWETSLTSLFQPATAAPWNNTSSVPLAIELQLSVAAPTRPAPHHPTDQGPPRVLARLVRPGRNTWVGKGLSWTKLPQIREHSAEQLRILKEIYALYKSRDVTGYSYSYSPYGSYGDETTIDLSRFDSRQLWPMLEDADALGIRLVHRKKQLGEIDRFGTAELCLDVTRDTQSESLAVAPILRIEGTDVGALPVAFVGTDGHGVVYVDSAEAARTELREDWHLRLAKLVKEVPPQLQGMALANERLRIRSADLPRFDTEYFPRLRHVAAVISSDESYTPPAIPEPTLVMRAAYRADHALEVNWEWAYEIGDTRLRTPLHPTPEAGYRDLDREQAVLADLPFERFGLLGVEHAHTESGPSLAPRAALAGIDTMRFTTEVLPLLTDQPGVVVEVSGEPADYREAGDSLSIGVSTRSIADDPDWFGLGVTVTVEGQRVPFATLFMALAAGQSYLMLPDGVYFSLEKPELQALRRLIEEARALQDSPNGPLRISRFQVGLWDELAGLGVVDRQAKAWQRQLEGLRSIGTVDCTEPPPTLTAMLRPYQLEGFRWLAFLWKFQLGGILADDMGLGKTLQALALICHAKQADGKMPPFLIVAPTSVMSNWATESARFAPGLNVVTLPDTLKRRGQTLDEAIGDADVVITTYTLFRLDIDAYSEQSWSGLILDEAQFAKNHQSKIHQCARRLPAPFKLCVTGTPMENNLMELWSLLSISAPGLFPNPTRFEYYYARPIEKQSDAGLLAQLRQRIKPLVKRRTKEQVAADLPLKQEQVLEVDLHPRHRKLYQTHLQRERQKVLGLVQDLNRNRFAIFRSLTLLRQLSLHGALIDEKHRDLPCAKVDALLEQLQDVVDGGHRALVFSQFTGFLDIVRKRFDAAGTDYCYLDGKTRNRATVLKNFKDGSVPVFLISLKAGGFGLNLTEADYCFLLDPWWNPATEAQAVDRTHRIGQTRNVMVYRLIAKDTIEEKVMALKAKKAELFASVMDDGNMFGSSLGADDIRELFA